MRVIYSGKTLEYTYRVRNSWDFLDFGFPMNCSNLKFQFEFWSQISVCLETQVLRDQRWTERILDQTFQWFVLFITHF
jgi:hypothetical protein